MSTSRHVVGWHASGSIAGALIAGVVTLAAGIVTSRADVACLALPLLSWVAWCWQNRPTRDMQVASTITTAYGPEQAGLITGSLHVTASSHVAMAETRMLVGAARRSAAVLDCRRDASLSVSVPVQHSGPSDVLTVTMRFASADGAFISQPTSPHTAEQLIRPDIVTLPHVLLPHRLHGLTGGHESTRPGEGGSFRDIHPFTPGDRLRRIDWKATARLARRDGDLYVRRTFAESDATIVIVMDTGDQLGEVVAEWASGRPHKSGTTSMDAAREAAASIAVAYTDAGDQVALQNLALGTRQVRRGSGARHRERLLATITATRPNGVGWTRRRAPLVASGALIYVLSTFIDSEAASLASMWRAAGHRVIAIDTLPIAITRGLTPEQATAHTILMMERDDRLRELQATGVSVVRWADAAGLPTRAAQFSALAREREGSR
ncbi:DUF58 domain-containing protein [Paramicrobacterium agarici]|uniref:Uncharacterized protein (DUF58 family) n=1 Tax=Paramicrobacterium agarici TaxID=630514 RepID=A0A2A9DYB9_9MICO|nr:DUF58 domain-containing protein [Microbacterium agarici]PFG31356.1 uncharacterized protein (DUF58 family) [Microbacterium agarici]